MKIKSTKLIAMLLVVAMMFSFSSVAFATTGGSEQKTIKYVSIGDSMTNGYGFTGYNQDEHDVGSNLHTDTDEYNYFTGKGVYGEGSYALQFEEYLTELGYDVDHTKLATSAFRAEDLYLLLGLGDSDPKDSSKWPLKDGYFGNVWNYFWNGCDVQYKNQIEDGKDPLDSHEWPTFIEGTSCGYEGYMTWYVDACLDPTITTGNEIYEYEAQFEYLRDYFTTELIEADVISLALGNAAFDAYFMDRLFKIWGAMGGGEFSDGKYGTQKDYIYYEMTLEDTYELVDEDQRYIVDELYNAMYAVISSKLGTQIAEDVDADRLCQLMTYITFSYMKAYKAIIEWIGANNPDAEIMLVGLLNSHYGISITSEGEEVVNMGETMGAIYEVMNDYIVGIAADYMANNAEFDGAIYYVDQPDDPTMISKVIPYVAAENWGKLYCDDPTCVACMNNTACENGRLDGSIIRYKTITAYNEILWPGIKAAGLGGSAQTYPFNDCNAGITDGVELALSVDADMTVKEFLVANAWDASVKGEDKRNWVVGSLAYLGCERVMLESLDKSEIDVQAVVTYSDNEQMLATLQGLGNIDVMDVNRPMADIIDDLADFFRTNMLGVIRFFALNKMGNGIAAHPTPENHDRLAVNMIAAYGNPAAEVQNVKSDALTVNKAYSYLLENEYINGDQTNAIIDYLVDTMLLGDQGEAATLELAEFIVNEVYDYEGRTDAEKIDIIGNLYTIFEMDGYINDEIKPTATLVEALYDMLSEKGYITDAMAVSIVDFVGGCLKGDGVISDQEVKDILHYTYYTLTNYQGSALKMAVTPGDLTAAEKIQLLKDVVGVMKDPAYTPIVDVSMVTPILDTYDALDGLVTPDEAIAVFETILDTYTAPGVDFSDEAVQKEAAETAINTILADKPADVKIQIMATVAGTLGGSITGGTGMPEIPSIDDLPAEVKEIYNYLSA
ncbi:MAG: hypothetical protein IKV66_00300, partial [Clostridia bacterium]|nr:hypothetical protein [Clostridia bacterium]